MKVISRSNTISPQRKDYDNETWSHERYWVKLALHKFWGVLVKVIQGQGGIFKVKYHTCISWIVRATVINFWSHERSRVKLAPHIWGGGTVKVIQGQDVIFKVKYQKCSESQAKSHWSGHSRSNYWKCSKFQPKVIQDHFKVTTINFEPLNEFCSRLLLKQAWGHFFGNHVMVPRWPSQILIKSIKLIFYTYNEHTQNFSSITLVVLKLRPIENRPQFTFSAHLRHWRDFSHFQELVSFSENAKNHVSAAGGLKMWIGADFQWAVTLKRHELLSSNFGCVRYMYRQSIWWIFIKIWDGHLGIFLDMTWFEK